jgi:tetratricopeptide (TPR) repeat protein
VLNPCPAIAVPAQSNVLRFAILFWCVLGSASVARADGPSDDATTTAARAHYQAGTTQYNLGRFEEAIGEYRKAYELKNDPVFLFNIAQAYRQLGHRDRALFFYRRYLSTAPDSPHRDEVQTRITELEQKQDEHPVPPAPSDKPLVQPPAMPEPEETSTALLADTSETDTETHSVVRTWWFWSAVGAVVVVGGAALVLALSDDGDDVPQTRLGTWDLR